MILVTGGAGFIGSNVVASLNEAGRTDVAVNDWLGSDGKWRNLQKRQVADMVAPAELFRWLDGRKLDAVIHLGAISDTTVTDGDAVMDNNFRLSLRLLDWCTETRTPFIYASSAATYGDGGQGFSDEWSVAALKRLEPMNLYGWSKHLFDLALAERVARREKMPPQWSGCKFFNVFGPNEYHKGAMMSLVAKKFDDAKAGKPIQLFKSHRDGIGDGEQSRDFIYVDDAVAVVRWMLETPHVTGIFNVGTGKARSFKDLISRDVCGARCKAEHRVRRHAARDPEPVSILYTSRGRQPAARGLQRGLRAAGRVGAPLRHAVSRSGRPVPLMLDFEKRLASIAQQSILCVGDLMLDDFVYGEVGRISPEAPAPVLAVKRNEVTIGGAGNVARNIASLGARCIFVGMVGEDAAGRDAIARLQAEQLIEPSLVIDAARPTTKKMRFVSEHFSTHLLRADWEQAGPVSAELEGELIARALAAIPRVGAVVLSDYAKGVLTPRVVAEVIAAAKRARVPVIVDPKAADYAMYRGATVITPNRRELTIAIRRECVGDAAILAAAEELAGIVECEAVVVTRSEEGMTLFAKGEEAVHVPAYAVKVRDVSGPGDTVVAILSVMLALGADYEARCAPPMRVPLSWSASLGPQPSASTSCAIACCLQPRPRSRTRSCSTARCSMRVLPNGGVSACVLVSPTAVSISCTAATSG